MDSKALLAKIIITCLESYIMVMFLVSANDLTGKKVIGLNGDAIGQVKDVEFDARTWKINNLLLKLSDKAASGLGYKKTSGTLGPLSLTHGNKSVYMPVTYISSISDVITINKTIIEITEDQLVKKYSE
jgi:sporulation protein YlmC with PRC-barrel domain